MPKLYIAFGSNLCKKQMRFRCPTARPIGKFMLRDALLTFRSVADLEYIKGAETPCGLWAVNTEDERSLDKYEGVSSGVYFKSEELQIDYAGRKRSALIYLKNSDAIYPPSRHYADIIRRGYRDFGLDEKYLNEAIARSYAEKSPDSEVLSRRRRQRSTPLQRELAKYPGMTPKAPSVPNPMPTTMTAPLFLETVTPGEPRDSREEQRDAFS